MITDRIIEQQSIIINFSSLWLFERESKQQEILFVPYNIDKVQDEQGQDQCSFAQAASAISFFLATKTQWAFGHIKSLWQEKRIVGGIIIFVLLNIIWLGALTPVSAHSNNSHTLPPEKHSQMKLTISQEVSKLQHNGDTPMSTMSKQPSPSACSKEHIVTDGETLSSIASTVSMDWTTIATVNHLNDPNSLTIGQSLCIPLSNTQPSHTTAVGQTNVFAFPECTWWANERYHQLHGVYVPWVTDADAWQWIARAKYFGWHTTGEPSKGAIIVLQPYTQGAFHLGHVGVVENVLPNGHVITSNMNWGQSPTTVTNIEFTPGSGVSFITL